MSFDSLPECFQKCIFAAGESVGCSSTDVVCICTKDLPDATGTQLTVCVLNECPLEIVPTVGDDFLAICTKVTGSTSGSSSATTAPPSSSSVSRGTTPPGTTALTNAPSRTSSSAPGGTSTGDAPRGSSGSSGSGGLSTGAKAGIGVGVGIVVILLMAAAFLYGRRWRSKPLPSSEPGSGPTPLGSPGMAPAPTAYEEDRTPELAGEKMVPELAGNTIVPELGGRAISELESERKTEPTPTYGAIAGTNETSDGSNMHATWASGTNAQGTQGAQYTQGTEDPGGGHVQHPTHTTTNFPYQPIELYPTTVSQRGYQTGP